MHQLLWLETLLKLASASALVLFPLATIRLLGLPAASGPFWPRLLGVALLGVAAAVYVEGAWPGSKGLGLAGLIILNLLVAAALGTASLFGEGARTRRGSLILAGSAVLLFVLALFEIAHA